MSFGRKIAVLGVAALVFFPAALRPVMAQQKTAAITQGGSSEATFRSWLSSFEKNGAKISQAATRYDAGSRTLTIQGLTISWPAAMGADRLELHVEDLSVKSFQTDGQGVTFETLSIGNARLGTSVSPQAHLKLSNFSAENGRLPNLASFMVDPAKPFTTQIRLMRLLVGASADNASAQAISVGNSWFANSAILEGFSGAKVRLLQLTGVQSQRAADKAEEVSGGASIALLKVLNTDLDPYLRLFEPSAYLDRGSARPWVNMIESMEAHGLKIKNGPVVVDVATAQAGPLKLKQFSENLTDLFDRAATDPGFLQANPENASKIATAVRDAFALDALSGEGISVAGQNQSGAIKAAAAKLDVSNFTANSISRIRASGLDVVDATGNVTLSSLDIGGVNLIPVKNDAGKTTSTGSDVVGDTIVPTIASVGAEGLSLKLQGMIASLDNFDLSMAYFIGATPTNVKAKLEHLKFRAGDVAAPQIRQTFTDLGYNDVDLSLNFSVFWDDASSSILVDDLSVVGTDMGSLTISGSLAGISRMGFDSPTSVLPQEFASAGLRNMRVTFQNDGLFDRFIVRISEVNGKNVEEIKKLLSSNLPHILSGVNPSDLRNKFVFAAIAFLNDPRVLTLGATPADVVPLREVATGMRDPSKLPSLLNMEVNANSRR